MCGIWGITDRPDSGITPVQKAIMATVLTIKMEERGKHSYGYYISETNQIVKGTGFPSMHVTPEEMTNSNIILGHTRFASVGAQTPANAHPWRLKNAITGAELVGMHNGGVGEWAELNKLYGRKFEVDSQHLLQHIVESEDLSELRSYGAVAYRWTANPPEAGTESRVYLGKFNGGVLFIFGIHQPETADEKKAREKEKKPRRTIGVIFASTADACRVALRMAGIDYPDYTDYTVESGTLYFLDINPREPGSGKDSNSMFWYAQEDKKGLNLKSYSRDQARAARDGKSYEGWNSNLAYPNKAEIKKAIETGFDTIRAWDMVKFFVGLDRYYGRDKCQYCGLEAILMLSHRPEEKFCHNHWVRMIQDGDARVIPTRNVSEVLNDIGEVGEPTEEDIPLKCDLCEEGIAVFWDAESKTLGCKVCASGDWKDGNWEPIEAVMGKMEGDDSQKESDDDLEDYSAPVVKIEVEGDEKSGDVVEGVESRNSRLLGSVPPPLKTVNGRIICEDCQDSPAEGAYKVIYDPVGIRAESVVSRVFLLCHVCRSIRKLNPDRYPGVRKSYDIPLSDTSWGTSSTAVN